jgi:putative transferase (TIGR04331 family)
VVLLATTALESTWGETEPLLFLGEWCKRYECIAQWNARKPSVVPYHWDDRIKLRRDYDYLKNLHDELLRELAQVLGEHHGLERPVRFWQILLDPWLPRYLGVVFDRWEGLRVAFEACGASQTIVRDGGPLPPVRDQGEFLTAVTNDAWNHELCADILSFEYSGRCAIRRSSASGESAEDARIIDLADRRKGWMWQVASRVEQLLGQLVPNSEVAFVHAYFPIGSFLRLNMKLRQIPRFYLREFAWRDADIPDICSAKSPCREAIIFGRRPASRFEAFLHQRLGRDIPQVFLELFDYLWRRTAAIRLRPRVIFTANDHANNDVFKHWAAHKVHEGIPLIIMDHGGALPPLFGAMNCEEDIADVRTIWPLPSHPKHVQLPANKLAGRKRISTAGTRLLVIGQEMPRYAFDANSMPIAGQTLHEFDRVCRMHDALADGPRQAFLVKPNKNMGWRTRERYADRLGADKVCDEPRLERIWKTARVVVCTYPQTNFAEAMTIGIPAVLAYPRHLYETLAHLDGLFEELCRARIAFCDPQEAAAHLNAVWAEPTKWWESAPVHAARRRFHCEAADVRSDWLDPWVRFIRQQLQAELATNCLRGARYVQMREKGS